MSGFDLTTLLRTVVPDMMPCGVNRWQFSLDPRASECASIQLVPQWAIFRVALPHRLTYAPSPMAAIQRQMVYSGNVKLVTEHSRLELRAEAPLNVQTVDDRDWTMRQIGEVILGLRVAAADRPPEISADADNSSDADPELLADRCRATGWHAVVKADGEIHVDIEPRSVPRVISIKWEKSSLRARVILADGELAQAGDESRTAAAHFLLRASSSLRFARAWVSGPAAFPAEAGFECTIATCASDSPLVAAIDAIATACDLFGCEFEALVESPALARQYLRAAQGARGSVAQPVTPLHAPTTAPVLPRAAAAAVVCFPPNP